MQPNPDIITVGEAARMIPARKKTSRLPHVSPATVYRWLQLGILTPLGTGTDRFKFVSKTEVRVKFLTLKTLRWCGGRKWEP